MILDIRTLALICNLVLLGGFIAMFAFWRTNRQRAGTGPWVVSLFTALIGFSLIGLRGILPDFLSIIVANLMLICSMAFLAKGIRAYRGPTTWLWVFITLPILYITLIILFTYVVPSLRTRIVVMSLMYIMYSVLCLIDLFHVPADSRRNANISLKLIFLVQFLFMLVRLIVTLLSPEFKNLSDFMMSGNFQAMAFVITLFFYSGLTFTFIWINYSKLDDERLTLLSAIEQAPTSIIITNAEGDIEYVNPAFVEKTGYNAREIMGRNTRFLKTSDTSPAIYNEMWRAVNSGATWRGEFHNRKKSGELYWDSASIAPVLDNRGRISHIVSVNEDITETKKLQEHLSSMANHDALTGLPSRRLVLDRLESAMEMADRYDYLMAVLFIDLDKFKEINDLHGHEKGDETLLNIADQLQKSLRKADTVARLGGDEFLVVLPQVGDREGAEKVARGIIEDITSSKNVLDVGLSIGISVFPEHGRDARSLIRRADEAMYLVKQNGGNSWGFPGNLEKSALNLESDGGS